MLLKNHHNTAIIENDRIISYSDLLEKISCFGSFIPSDENAKVAIFSENRAEFIYVLYACWSNGAIPALFDITAEIDEISYILNEVQPALIFSTSKYAEKLRHILENAALRSEVIYFDEIEVSGQQESVSEIDPADLDATALIIYTSGTTAHPKGVMLSFKNLLANIRSILDENFEASENDSTLILLPLFHIFPLLWTVILGLYVGGTMIIVPSLEPKVIMELLAKYNVTIIVGVPKLFHLIRNKIMAEINGSALKKGIFNLAEIINIRKISRLIFAPVHRKFGTGLRYLICGGATIDSDAERDFRTLGFRLQTGYGMTETAPMIAFNRPGRSVIGSAGKPVLYNEVKIAGDGEILVKGDNVMQGYFGHAEETAEVLKAGWLHTGDIGRLDADGCLYIEGRKNEMIVLSGGKNINPLEIETKILDNTDLIAEIGIYPADDQLRAVIYSALSEVNTHSAEAEEAIRGHIANYNKSASPHKRITGITISHAELPKTLLGKIRRYQLAEFAEQQQRQTESVEEYLSDEFDHLSTYLEAEKNRSISLKDHFDIDIGLDSLDKVMLISYIENAFGITLNESTLNRYTTVGELARHIQKYKEQELVQTINWRDIFQNTNNIRLPKTWITHRLLQFIWRLFFSFYFRMNIQGLENIRPAPAIYVSNQQSGLDEFFVSAYLPPREYGRTFYFAKEKHFSSRWKKFLADHHNTILVNTNHDLRQAIRKLAACLRRGNNILIFPEGTRSIDGSINEFKKTFAILSCELNVPIIPVAIQGSINALPKSTLLPKPFKRIAVTFLNPVFQDNLSYESLTEKVSLIIREHVHSG